MAEVFKKLKKLFFSFSNKLLINLIFFLDYTKPIEPMVNSFQEISENEKVKNAFYSFSLQDIQQMDETNQKTNFHFRKTNTFEFKPSSMSQIDFKNLNKLAAIQENDEHQSKLFNREHSLDRMISESSSQSKTLILSEPPGLSRSISFQKQKEMKSAELSKKSSISTSTTLPSPFLNTATSPPIPLKISNSLSCNNLVSNNENTTPINESNKYASNFNVFAGEASKVLFVKGLEDPHIKVNFIYNLFSNFGNITKIIFLRNKNGALIEFQSIEYATIAKDFLNNLNFFSNYLRVVFVLFTKTYFFILF